VRLPLKKRGRGQEGKRARGQEGKRARGEEGKRASAPGFLTIRVGVKGGVLTTESVCCRATRWGTIWRMPTSWRCGTRCQMTLATLRPLSWLDKGAFAAATAGHAHAAPATRVKDTGSDLGMAAVPPQACQWRGRGSGNAAFGLKIKSSCIQSRYSITQRTNSNKQYIYIYIFSDTITQRI